MPDRARPAVAPRPAPLGAGPSRFRPLLGAVWFRLRAAWRRRSYRPERHYLRGVMPRGLAALVLLGLAWQAAPGAGPEPRALPGLVAQRVAHEAPVLRDGPGARPAPLPSAADPCGVMLRLESGVILPLFLTVVERAGAAAARPEAPACPGRAGAGPRGPRNRPEPGRVWVL